MSQADVETAFSGPDEKRFPPILSTEQVADLLQISLHSVRRKNSQGKFGDVVGKVCGKLRFDRNRLFKLIFEKGI